MNQFNTNLIPNTIGNRKRDCAWGCAREWAPPEKICRLQRTKQEGIRSTRPTDLCFAICRFSQVVSIPRAQPHAQSLFLFPIVFGIYRVFWLATQRCPQNDSTGWHNRVNCDVLAQAPFVRPLHVSLLSTKRATLTMVSMETKVVSEDSILGKLSEKLYLNGFWEG